MGGLVVPNCCGCISLRTGSLVIASVYMIAPTLVLLYVILAYIAATAAVQSDAKETTRTRWDGTTDIRTTGLSQSEKDDAQAFINGIFVLALVILIALILVQVSLIVGVVKKSNCLIMTWIVFECIYAFVYGCGIIFSVLGLVNHGSVAFGQFVSAVASFALSVYFIIVVNSHRQEVLREQRMPAVSAPMNVVTYSPTAPVGFNYTKGDYPQPQPQSGYYPQGPGYPPTQA